MLDREARNKGVRVISEFKNGAISNKEYERRYPTSAGDLALAEIFNQIWFLYSDIRKHTLNGKYALNPENSALVERCVLFLRSNAEFKWPPQRIHRWQAFLRIVGLGMKAAKSAMGDENIWPFFEKVEYEQALKDGSSVRKI